MTPALFTMISTPWKKSRAYLKASSTSSSLLTSQRFTQNLTGLCGSNLLAMSDNFSVSMSRASTFTLFSKRVTVIASPMPDAAPVTTAVLPTHRSIILRFYIRRATFRSWEGNARRWRIILSPCKNRLDWRPRARSNRFKLRNVSIFVAQGRDGSLIRRLDDFRKHARS